MKKEIKQHFINEYNVEINVELIKRALHMGIGTYTYVAQLSIDPLASFQGYYTPKDDSFNPISMDYILFTSNFRKKINSFIENDNVIATLYINAFGGNVEVDYSNISLNELVKLSGDNCYISLHIYSFTCSNLKDVDWLELQPVINYLKELPDIKYSVNFSYYPPEIFNNEDVRANKFGFGYEYSGYETCFEGWNLDKRLDIFEINELVTLDTLLVKWEEKLKEADERINEE